MKLVTFRTGAGDGTSPAGAGAPDAAGLLLGDTVVDLANAFAWFEHAEGRPSDPAYIARRFGATVLGFIEHADRARPAAEAIARAFQVERTLPPRFDGRPVTHALRDVSLRAPIPRPPSVRDGYAFRQHVETARRNRGLEMIPEFDRFPVYYYTNHHAVVGPGDVVLRRRFFDKLDYELEAAIVIGKEATGLTAANADQAVFGMTIMNDWSARAIQMEEMKLNLGPAKGKDFATSLGPWLVTLDELLPRATQSPPGDLPRGRGLRFDLEMRARVNGQLLSRGNLSDMTWTFAQILERISDGATLYPGDVVGSGTCGTGCLLELNGTRAAGGATWLNPGDVVELEIDGLGTLANRVVLDQA
jgi:fumarylacetoacetate (FAA) hydrolase